MPFARTPDRGAHRAVVIALQAITCLIVAAAGAYRVDLQAAGPTTLSWGITILLVWAVCSWWWVVGTVFDPYGMFMLSLFLFNGGQALLEVLGLNARGILEGRFDDDVLVATMYMVLLGVSFTHFGALLAARGIRKSFVARAIDSEGRALRTVGWTLLVLSLPPAAVLLATTARTIMAGGYLAAYQADSAVGVAAGPAVLATFLIPASLMLLAGAGGRRRAKWTAAVVIGVYTLTQLALGYRSTAIMPAAAFLWLWDACESTIRKRWIIAACALLFAVVIPISGDTRMIAGSDRTAISTFLDSFASMKNPLVSSLAEIGGSMATVAHTYELVPTSRPFDRGVAYGYAALTVVPNLFWDIHPTIAHGNLSQWLVETVDPWAAKHQGGLGYSCIAEAYLNFGWLGVPIIMGLVGFCIAMLSRIAARDRRHLALAALCVAFILKFPRDETASMVRAFVWYSWIPYLTVTAMVRTRRKVAIDVPIPTVTDSARLPESLA